MRHLPFTLRARGRRDVAPLRRWLLVIPLACAVNAGVRGETLQRTPGEAAVGGMIESSPGGPQAVVRLPTLHPASGTSLRLQPNVQLHYQPAPPPANAAARPRMFLARSAAAAADSPSPDTPSPDTPQASLTAAESARGLARAAQPLPPGEAVVEGELPPPRSALEEPWSLEDQVLSEELFLHRLRQQAVHEEGLADVEILDGGGLQAESWDGTAAGDGSGHSILAAPLGEGLVSGGARVPGGARRAPRDRWFKPTTWGRRGLDRIAASRQRVDAGLGSLVVAHAPLMLDTTQPRNQIRLRGDFGYDIAYPDRSEYYWASPNRGPGYVGDIDYQEFAFMFELGGEAFSLQTELPIRGYDPQFGGGHTALGDMRITPKLRIVNGKDVQVAAMLRIHAPTGNTNLGAGTGHVSLEPGGMFRYRYNDWTYLHAELKYRFPIGGDPLVSGDVLSYGFGVSSVWYETLTSAVIPTLELTSINFLTGRKTDFLGPRPVDGEVALALHPGLRFAWDPGGDLGTVELGVGSALGLSRDRFYDSLLRFELRLCR